MQGSHEYRGLVNFGAYSNNSAMCDRRKQYYPLVIQATCMNPTVAGYFHQRILYFEFNLATAVIRPVQQKIVTESGAFTIEQAFGLNSGRNDDDSQKECVICLTENKSALAKPCNHVSTCWGCAQVIMASNRQCPICRQTVTEMRPLNIVPQQVAAQ